MQKKLLEDIWQVCNSEYKGDNRVRALKMLNKMTAFKDGVTLAKMDAFIVDFKRKYDIGSIIVSRQLTNSSNCWCVTYAVGSSMSSYHVLKAVSLDEAYVKLCLSLFSGVKSGEYKRRGV